MPGNPCRDRNGVVWASQSACARAHGVSPSAVSSHLERNGNLDRMACGIRFSGKRPAKAKPLDIDGQAFASQSDLARKLGTTRQVINRLIRTNRIDLIRRKLERLK